MPRRRQSTRRTTFLASVAWDLLFGEPPGQLHPVSWMGRGLAAARRAGRNQHPAVALGIGSAALLGGIWIVQSAARRAERTTTRLPPPLRTGVDAVTLKSTFAVRGLFGAVRRVERALERGDLERARARLGRDLVSRDTTKLTADEVAAAAIESLAENLSDSVIAPWLAYRFAGLPTAAIYRFVNTADAMLGYRTPELEWLGKPAARLDDVFNVVPARLTAALIALCAPAGRGRRSRAWQIARRDHTRTASPNAGWPMAAMAGALDRRLSKHGAYCLNQGAAAPSVADITRARRIAAAAVATATVAFAW